MNFLANNLCKIKSIFGNKEKKDGLELRNLFHPLSYSHFGTS
jgi:hypothetical protein